MASRFDFASLIPLGLDVDSVNDGESALVVTARSNAATASCDFVARIRELPQFGYLASLLREADILWTPEFEHSVQCNNGNCDLGCSTTIGA